MGCSPVPDDLYLRGLPPDLANVAVTDWSLPVVIVQVDVPEQAPPQPLNVVREPAAAVSVTVVAEPCA